MDAPEAAAGLHAHCERCVKLSRCAQAAPVGGPRCELVDCPVGCGHRLHRCKLAEHRLLCPEEQVPCINAEYGCAAVLARRLRAAHLTDCPASVVLCMAEWNRWPLLAPGRPRTLYAFQCAQPLRRDEFAHHYRRVHGDVHGGAGAWLERRCPLAQYGCPHVADRLYPDRPQQRFVVSPVTGCVGVTVAGSADAPPDLGLLTTLPFEVLEHIAALLDPFSLNHLSLTCRLLRDVCASLVESRGLVMLMWSPIRVDGRVTWRSVAKSWRFSGAFEPVRTLGFRDGRHVADHMRHCAHFDRLDRTSRRELSRLRCALLMEGRCELAGLPAPFTKRE
ncbi:F-box only protein 30-like [Pollicipes pollicipes]|uniref:F-box only protein 30-like n=1 Tax=Pollicipes pollicipes TaxID=41117 RepID=UPI0018855E78|nr:F-box only protein 30-like [Pollicipes pollicipes]